jgi:hypothetical protein
MFNLIGKKILLPILYDKSVQELKKIITDEEGPAFIGNDYTYEHDILLLKCVSEYGLKC